MKCEKGDASPALRESPPSRGAWIEITPGRSGGVCAGVAPLAGGVD